MIRIQKTDLTGKCGSCSSALPCPGKNYHIVCVNPNKAEQNDGRLLVKTRTYKACKDYSPKENGR